MKRLFVAAALSAALISAGSIATPLRWASAGDPLTMDPHSQNEGLTNSMNGQVYETLMKRDRMEADRRIDLALQAAPKREIP
jgi:peptide/nickel transport system substrate-binding protein